MSRRCRPNATGRNEANGKHVRLHRWLLRSAAWQHTSLAGRCLLVELYDLFNGENNGDLFMSVREAAQRLGTGKDRAHAALKELCDHGFICPVGSMVAGTVARMATRWRLTEFEYRGNPPDKLFMSWRPPNPVPATRTACPSHKDRSQRRARKLPDLSSPQGQVMESEPLRCPAHRDTDSLPCGEGSEPQRRGALRTHSAESDATADRGPRSLAAVMAGMPGLPDQIDIEEAIARAKAAERDLA